MRSLFLKIFLWFWATVVLTGIALIITFGLQPGGVPARWHAALGETARVYGNAVVAEMERGGPLGRSRLTWTTSRETLTPRRACSTWTEPRSQAMVVPRFMD